MPPLIRAAWVIGRRDFVAVIFSKAFFFFLLGPIFPLAIGIAAGSIGGQVARDIDRPVFGLVMDQADAGRLIAARDTLAERLGEARMPELRSVPAAQLAKVRRGDGTLDRARLLDRGDVRFVAIVSGGLDAPRLTAPAAGLDRWQGPLALMVEQARRGGGAVAAVRTEPVAESSGSRQQSRLVTAQAGQALLVLLTMLLAGMVLSNLVEEKTNKIIEILAAAVPIDAIFLGKLFAMLGMAMIGICAWGALAVVGLTVAGGGVPALPPPPAIGWPLFLLLGIAYFAMAYLLLGSLFLGIGAMATTVREVQTLSMPATMGQLIVFFLAAYSVTKIGQPIEIVAVLVPFSSPFAMLARAAQRPELWPHLLALVWQGVWVLVIIRFGAGLFRRNVLKSGRGPGRKSLWSRMTARG